MKKKIYIYINQKYSYGGRGRKGASLFYLLRRISINRENFFFIIYINKDVRELFEGSQNATFSERISFRDTIQFILHNLTYVRNCLIYFCSISRKRFANKKSPWENYVTKETSANYFFFYNNGAPCNDGRTWRNHVFEIIVRESKNYNFRHTRASMWTYAFRP